MSTIWSFPTRVVFGAGQAARVGDEARLAGIGRALLVTDPAVLELGLSSTVQKALSLAGIEFAVFSGVTPNPTEADVEAGAEAFAAHRADGIVAVGGGSPVDCAKLIAVRAKTSRSLGGARRRHRWRRAHPPGRAAGGRAADHQWHRQRSRTLRRAHREVDGTQDGDLRSSALAEVRHPRSRADARACHLRSALPRASMRSLIASRPTSRSGTTRWRTRSRSRAWIW